MIAASQPWMKFYPQDWRADEKLRLCSLAARGLWIEMLAIMHRSERYGFLLIAGSVPTDTQLAVQVGASPQEVTDLLGELRTAGVFSCAARGMIYSRRMTRDKRKSIAASKNGKIGGRATAQKTAKNEHSPKRISSDGPSLEARGQSSDTNVSGVPPPIDPVKALFDLGLSLLTEAGHTPSNSRSLIGKWRKGRGDDVTLAAIIAARRGNVSNPVEWIEGRLRAVAQSNDGLYAQAARFAA